ncbi:MAG TPA: hypothetical protein VK158_06000 [Acidobacteriota bacterium]|nr:hypothetical protein [Acidobacteriota bacterium]
MVFKPVLRILEERRLKLIETLRAFDTHESLDRQHQLYGAIQELELVMRTLQYQQKRVDATREELSAANLLNETAASQTKKLDSYYHDLFNNRFKPN